MNIISSRLGLSIAVGVALFVGDRDAQAQAVCTQAAACCQAMSQASGGRMSSAQCDAINRIAASPQAASMCPQMLSQMQSMATMMASRTGGSPPAACAASTTPNSPQGGGGSGGTTDSPPAPPPPIAPPAPPQLPPVLPPDPTEPTHASSGLLACVVDRVDGHRVLLAGASTTLAVRCSGIPSSGNPNGAGAPVTPPAGGRVRIEWTLAGSPGNGTIVPQGASVRYTAPAHAPHPADVVVNVHVQLLGGPGHTEDVRLPRTIHVIDRNYTLQFDTLYTSVCRPVTDGTLLGAYNLACTGLRANFSIRDDYSVQLDGGGTCANALTSGFTGCAPQIISGEARGNNTITNITGNLDPSTGSILLHLDGERWGMPAVHFVNGRSQEPHPVAIMVPPLPVVLEDGWTRTFGTAAPNSGGAGGTTTITIHTR